MNKKSMEVMVGGFVLLGLLGLLFLAFKAANLGGVSSGGGYSLVAKFDNIGGLKPRAPVRSAGVTVGRVTSIALDPVTYQGVVKLELEPSYTFPKDSSARILTAGLLGDQYVGLEPGADEKLLGAGDTITQTQSAVVLETLISQFLFNKASDAGDASAAKAK